MPNLLVGDFILVNKFNYGLRLPVANTKFMAMGEPKRGDVVVFRYPGRSEDDPEKGTDYIKRVIGLPGDVIDVSDDQVTINDQPVAYKPDGVFVGYGLGPGQHRHRHRRRGAAGTRRMRCSTSPAARSRPGTLGRARRATISPWATTATTAPTAGTGASCPRRTWSAAL